jgi:hypothetical protein
MPGVQVSSLPNPGGFGQTITSEEHAVLAYTATLLQAHRPAAARLMDKLLLLADMHASVLSEKHLPRTRFVVMSVASAMLLAQRLRRADLLELCTTTRFLRHAATLGPVRPNLFAPFELPKPSAAALSDVAHRCLLRHPLRRHVGLVNGNVEQFVRCLRAAEPGGQSELRWFLHLICDAEDQPSLVAKRLDELALLLARVPRVAGFRLSRGQTLDAQTQEGALLVPALEAVATAVGRWKHLTTLGTQCSGVKQPALLQSLLSLMMPLESRLEAVALDNLGHLDGTTLAPLAALLVRDTGRLRSVKLHLATFHFGGASTIGCIEALLVAMRTSLSLERLHLVCAPLGDCTRLAQALGALMRSSLCPRLRDLHLMGRLGDWSFLSEMEFAPTIQRLEFMPSSGSMPTKSSVGFLAALARRTSPSPLRHVKWTRPPAVTEVTSEALVVAARDWPASPAMANLTTLELWTDLARMTVCQSRGPAALSELVINGPECLSVQEATAVVCLRRKPLELLQLKMRYAFPPAMGDACRHLHTLKVAFQAGFNDSAEPSLEGLLPLVCGLDSRLRHLTVSCDFRTGSLTRALLPWLDQQSPLETLELSDPGGIVDSRAPFSRMPALRRLWVQVRSAPTTVAEQYRMVYESRSLREVEFTLHAAIAKRRFTARNARGHMCRFTEQA